MYNCHFDWKFYDIKPATAAGWYGHRLFYLSYVAMSYCSTIKLDFACGDGADGAVWDGSAGYTGGQWGGGGQQSRVEGIYVPPMQHGNVDIKTRTGNSGNGGSGVVGWSPELAYTGTGGGSGGYNRTTITCGAMTRNIVKIDCVAGDAGDAGDASQVVGGETFGKGGAGGDVYLEINFPSNVIESIVEVVGVAGNAGSAPAHPHSNGPPPITGHGSAGNVSVYINSECRASVIDVDLTGGAGGPQGGNTETGLSVVKADITQSFIGSDVTVNLHGPELTYLDFDVQEIYRPKLYGTAKLLIYGFITSQALFFKKEDDLDFSETDPTIVNTRDSWYPLSPPSWAGSGNPVRVNGIFNTSPTPAQHRGWFSGALNGDGAPLPGYTVPSGQAWFRGRYWERSNRPDSPP
jgi:hypothetical protein